MAKANEEEKVKTLNPDIGISEFVIDGKSVSPMHIGVIPDYDNNSMEIHAMFSGIDFTEVERFSLIVNAYRLSGALRILEHGIGRTFRMHRFKFMATVDHKELLTFKCPACGEDHSEWYTVDFDNYYGGTDFKLCCERCGHYVDTEEDETAEKYMRYAVWKRR